MWLWAGGVEALLRARMETDKGRRLGGSVRARSGGWAARAFPPQRRPGISSDLSQPFVDLSPASQRPAPRTPHLSHPLWPGPPPLIAVSPTADARPTDPLAGQPLSRAPGSAQRNESVRVTALQGRGGGRPCRGDGWRSPMRRRRARHHGSGEPAAFGSCPGWVSPRHALPLRRTSNLACNHSNLSKSLPLLGEA